nr:DUF11 domain-containing protein [Plantibacter sp. VKM Ac-2880]
MQIRAGSVTGPIVNDTLASTTTGTGSTVTPGTGTTGGYSFTPGTEYFITEDPAGTTNLAQYAATVTCTDSAGIQPNLPTDASLGAGLAITPVRGSNVSCTVTNAFAPAPAYTVAKSASVPRANPGDVVTYTVTVTNTGNVDYTAASPAAFTDDLTAVLDDATYNGDAAGGATVSGSTLSWSGPLALGETKTVTYSVTVDNPDNGDHNLGNTVTPAGPGGSCDPAGACVTNTPIQSYSTTKTADRTEVVPGDTITYTITVTNTGQAEYTADAPATFTDDLSGVLDDATYNDDASSGANYTAPTLSWSGPLAVGATVTVTYSVTVNDPDTGDKILPNAVVTSTGGNCPPGSTDPACIVEIPARAYTVAKSVDQTTVDQNGTITYTVTVTNTGKVAYTDERPASFDDDLSGVLDDATYNDDASNGATVDGVTLSWSGPLDVGATVNVAYSVTVNNPDTGDKVLNNFVRPTVPGGTCATEGGCATSTPVRSLEVSKTVDSTNTAPGKKLTYTITITNTGAADYTTASPATFTDDLSAVLDDASYNGDANGGATYATPVVSWRGALAVGAAQVVTYSVTVNNPDTGDHVLRNAVVSPGSNCLVGSSDPACSVTTKVPKQPLASTGVGAWLGVAGIGALIAILMGLGATFIRRREITE